MKITTNQNRLNELFDKDPRNDTAIATALGVSKQTLSMWRHGTRSPKKSALVKISEEYGVSIEWLMGFDVDKNVNRMTEVIVADSEMFAKLLYHMSREDYTVVMDIFNKTYQKMKAMGIEFN
jgi:transcriptional regulator with XRE-family HTH domain